MKKYLNPIIAMLVFGITQGIAGVVVMVPYVFTHIDEVKSATDTQKLMQVIPADLIAWATILSGVLTVAILALLKMIDWKNVVNVSGINWKKAALYVLAAVCGIFALDIFEEMLNLPNLMEEAFTGMAKTVSGVLCIGILGPIAEEFVFREAALGSMLRNKINPMRAIFISAVLFGVVHGNPAQIPFAAAMGIILGYIYYKTGNIVVPALIHILNNSFACWTMVAFSDMAEEPKLVDMLGGTVPAVGCAVAGLALCIGIFVWAEKSFGHYGKVRLTTKDGEWVKQTWDFDGNKKEETL